MAPRNGLLSIVLLYALTIPLIATHAAEQSDYLTGQLLVATPEMRDPRFAETVIYMVKHRRGGRLRAGHQPPVGERPYRRLAQRVWYR